MSKLVKYAAKLVDNETAARNAREAAPAAAVQPVVPAAPVAPIVVAPPTPVPTPVEDNGVERILGWSLVGVGVAALATGISFWALDGRSTGDCFTGTNGAQVCSIYSTRTLGEVLTAVGAVGVVAGGVLLWRAESDGGTQVAVGPGSLFIRGRF